MRSQLTRRVFRHLLSNQGVQFPCLHQSALRAHRRDGPSQRAICQSPQCRSFFGFGKIKREPRAPRVAAGLNQMAELTRMERAHTRPPASKELVRAFVQFFDYKEKLGEAVTSFQAPHVLRTLRHLLRLEKEETRVLLTREELRKAFQALKKMPNDDMTDFKILAEELYQEITRRCPDPKEMEWADTRCLSRILLRTGDRDEIRKMALSHEGSKDSSGNMSIARQQRELWLKAFDAHAMHDDEAELLKTVEMFDATGLGWSSGLLFFMVKFYTSQNHFEGTKLWYSKHADLKIGAGSSEYRLPTPPTLKAVVDFCSRNGQLDWCKTVFRDLLKDNSVLPKRHWDVIFLWAAGALGKGVEDVERMIKVMMDNNEHRKPDADTINGLVGLAISKKDPYLAERYIAMGRKLGVRPNAKTYIMQLEYRLEAGDISGADAAYASLQAEEIFENEDLHAINMYVRTLCRLSSVATHYSRIQEITTYLDQRRARLDADTIAALVLVYLRQEEILDVQDLLQTTMYELTLAERACVRDAILSFCLDRTISNSRVWRAYDFITVCFDETDIETRTKIMNEFFFRRRSDMASHVFGHMRQHNNLARRPKLETYITCFEGIARCADDVALQMVHNMFKMDVQMEPNTRLYNSLMMAYTACGDGYHALDLWGDITNSTEGPSYRSLELVFQACQRKPFGDKPARQIWQKMRKMDIQITREVYAAYCGALSGQGKVDEVLVMIEGMENDVGFQPDLLTIGTIFNATHGSVKKEKISKWTAELYPEIWEEMQQLGFLQHEEGYLVLQMPERENKA